MSAAIDVEVGHELPPLVLTPVDRTTLALFAGASGDHNPIHVDPEHARRLGYDDVFAHGMLSMAWLGRLLTGWVPPERLLSYGVRFTARTPVHAMPTCTGVVSAVEDGVATIDVRVVIDTGEVTLSGTARVALDPGRWLPTHPTRPEDDRR
jgi:acyl dehydratase